MNLTDEMRVKIAEALGWTGIIRDLKYPMGVKPDESRIHYTAACLSPSVPYKPASIIPKFETSVDAALTLCDRLREEGWNVSANLRLNGTWRVSLFKALSDGPKIEDPSLARAICLAFLKVKDSVARSL